MGFCCYCWLGLSPFAKRLRHRDPFISSPFFLPLFFFLSLFIFVVFSTFVLWLCIVWFTLLWRWLCVRYLIAMLCRSSEAYILMHSWWCKSRSVHSAVGPTWLPALEWVNGVYSDQLKGRECAVKVASRCVSIFLLATGDFVWMCTLNMPLWIVLDTLSVCCEVLLFASVTCVCACVGLMFDSTSLLTLPGHTKSLGVWILVDSRDSWKQQNTQQNTIYIKISIHCKASLTWFASGTFWNFHFLSPP